MYIVAVNDAFVTKAWGATFPGGLEQGFRFLADQSGALTKALDMGYDSAGVWGTDRSKRYALLVENGVVQKVWAEGDNTGVKGALLPNSSARKLADTRADTVAEKVLGEI